MNGDCMTDAGGVDTLEIRAPIGGLVVGVRCIGEGRLGRVVVVSEDAGPLLAGLIVVLWVESCIGTAVIDLHSRSRARVSGVHVFGDAAPDGRSADDIALGTAAVPRVDLVAR